MKNGRHVQSSSRASDPTENKSSLKGKHRPASRISELTDKKQGEEKSSWRENFEIESVAVNNHKSSLRSKGSHDLPDASIFFDKARNKKESPGLSRKNHAFSSAFISIYKSRNKKESPGLSRRNYTFSSAPISIDKSRIRKDTPNFSRKNTTAFVSIDKSRIKKESPSLSIKDRDFSGGSISSDKSKTHSPGLLRKDHNFSGGSIYSDKLKTQSFNLSRKNHTFFSTPISNDKPRIRKGSPGLITKDNDFYSGSVSSDKSKNQSPASLKKPNDPFGASVPINKSKLKNWSQSSSRKRNLRASSSICTMSSGERNVGSSIPSALDVVVDIHREHEREESKDRPRGARSLLEEPRGAASRKPQGKSRNPRSSTDKKAAIRGIVEKQKGSRTRGVRRLDEGPQFGDTAEFIEELEAPMMRQGEKNSRIRRTQRIREDSSIDDSADLIEEFQEPRIRQKSRNSRIQKIQEDSLDSIEEFEEPTIPQKLRNSRIKEPRKKQEGSLDTDQEFSQHKPKNLRTQGTQNIQEDSLDSVEEFQNSTMHQETSSIPRKKRSKESAFESFTVKNSHPRKQWNEHDAFSYNTKKAPRKRWSKDISVIRLPETRSVSSTEDVSPLVSKTDKPVPLPRVKRESLLGFDNVAFASDPEDRNRDGHDEIARIEVKGADDRVTQFNERARRSSSSKKEKSENTIIVLEEPRKSANDFASDWKDAFTKRGNSSGRKKTTEDARILVEEFRGSEEDFISDQEDTSKIETSSNRKSRKIEMKEKDNDSVDDRVTSFNEHGRRSSPSKKKKAAETIIVMEEPRKSTNDFMSDRKDAFNKRGNSSSRKKMADDARILVEEFRGSEDDFVSDQHTSRIGANLNRESRKIRVKGKDNDLVDDRVTQFHKRDRRSSSNKSKMAENTMILMEELKGNAFACDQEEVLRIETDVNRKSTKIEMRRMNESSMNESSDVSSGNKTTIKPVESLPKGARKGTEKESHTSESSVEVADNFYGPNSSDEESDSEDEDKFVKSRRNRESHDDFSQETFTSNEDEDSSNSSDGSKKISKRLWDNSSRLDERIKGKKALGRGKTSLSDRLVDSTMEESSRRGRRKRKKGEEEEEKKKLKYISIMIHRTDLLETDYVTKHPMVKVHLVCMENGSYLKSDENTGSPYLQPMITGQFDFRKNRSMIPVWEEELIFEHDFDAVLKTAKEQIVILFEVIDLLNFSEASFNYDKFGNEGCWYKVAWAFLKPVGKNNMKHINKKVRLQLYRPHRNYKKFGRHKCEVYTWWKSNSREKYPSSLFVTITSVDPPTLEPIVYQQQPSKDPSLRSEIQRSSGRTSDSINLPKWTRLAAQSCKIPNDKYHETEISENGCFFVAFSNDGKFLACVMSEEYDYPIVVYEIESKKIHVRFEGHKTFVYSLCWSRNDIHLLSVSSDQTARIWDLRNKIVQHIGMMPHPSYVYCGRFDPDDASIVATGCYDRFARIWSMDKKSKSWELGQELEGHDGFVNSMCFQKDGSLLTADSLGVIVSWTLKKNRRLPLKKEWQISRKIKVREIEGITINTILLHPLESRILVHSRDNGLRMLDYATGVVLQKYHRLNNQRIQTRACISPCGSLIFCGGEDSSLNVWSLETGKYLAKYYLEPHYRAVTCVDYHPYDHVLAFSTFGSPAPVRILKFNKEANGEEIGLKLTETSSNTGRIGDVAVSLLNVSTFLDRSRSQLRNSDRIAQERAARPEQYRGPHEIATNEALQPANRRLEETKVKLRRLDETERTMKSRSASRLYNIIEKIDRILSNTSRSSEDVELGLVFETGREVLAPVMLESRGENPPGREGRIRGSSTFSSIEEHSSSYMVSSCSSSARREPLEIDNSTNIVTNATKRNVTTDLYTRSKSAKEFQGGEIFEDEVTKNLSDTAMESNKAKNVSTSWDKKLRRSKELQAGQVFEDEVTKNLSDTAIGFNKKKSISTHLDKKSKSAKEFHAGKINEDDVTKNLSDTAIGFKKKNVPPSLDKKSKKTKELQGVEILEDEVTKNLSDTAIRFKKTKDIVRDLDTRSKSAKEFNAEKPFEDDVSRTLSDTATSSRRGRFNGQISTHRGNFESSFVVRSKMHEDPRSTSVFSGKPRETEASSSADSTGTYVVEKSDSERKEDRDIYKNFEEVKEIAQRVEISDDECSIVSNATFTVENEIPVPKPRKKMNVM